ncbi:MAG: cell division ATP-binding protein FtsE, partial [Steroidobacteraceae bacterium]|nr:cell division ATP-binding protein FtsE [Steroidobacteraceae bacterium]
VLADEPTGNLDPQLAREIMQVFRRFQDAGVTLVIASHDEDLVGAFAQRQFLLDDGRLQELSGPAAAVAGAHA